jgi:5-methylcytosine-specific restriction endonuclease McrA
MNVMSKARIPASIKAHVFASFDCCAACGTWDADECGHVVAESKGGAMVVDNFVRLCGSCNRMQGTASVVFSAYAAYTESPALIKSRRAYWARYVKAAAVGIAKPYKPVA